MLPNYGWVQNTSNLSTVRDTIDLVPEHGIRHLDLREKIRKFREENNNLPKRWSWDARCRIKAIYACGLVKLDRNIQGYVLTEYGRALQKCKKSKEKFRGKRVLSDEEIEIYRESLLTNPPVIRVLSLFEKDRKNLNKGLSKYDVGAELGFVGDVGFTHYEPEWVVRNNYSFHNKEGDADKWARTIISWLRQVGWLERSDTYKDILGENLITYNAKEIIESVLRYDVRRISRIVPSEMLCSNHHPFPKLIQKRRIIILSELNKDKPVTINHLEKVLKNNDIKADNKTVEFEVISLRRAGFKIVKNDLYYTLDENIELDTDPVLLGEVNDENEPEIEKFIEDMVVNYESTIPERLVDNLIRYGYTGENEFEVSVYKFFKYLGYDAEYYGQGRGRVADVVAKYISTQYAKSYGIIIDAKASSNKYNFPAEDVRKMKEYIGKHGPELLKEEIYNHAYAFTSSEFIENVEKPLEEISKDTGISGTAIRIIELLELGKYIRNGDINIENLYSTFSTNKQYTTEFIKT